MPIRFAAVMASLLLIVSSIGVNVARYPAVWDMVSDARGLGTGDGGQGLEGTKAPALRAEVVLPHTVPESRAAEAGTLGAAQEPPQPLVAAGDGPPPAYTYTPPATVPPPCERAAMAGNPLREPATMERPIPPVNPLDSPSPVPADRPLVPVMLSGVDNGQPTMAAADTRVRRLPPLGQSPPFSASTALSPYASIAAYPRTATP